MWIYNLPNLVVCLSFVILLSATALAGHKLWRKFVKVEYDEEERGLAMGMLGVVAMMLSLLLAFSSMSVWDAYSGAESAAAAEASVSGELVRDLSVYGGPAANAAREAVRTYLRAVIEDEWPAMAAGGRSESASHKFNAIYRAVGVLSPRNSREQVLLAEIWSRTNELNVQRRARFNSVGGSAIPGALWSTIAFCMLFNFLLLYGMPSRRSHNMLIGFYAGTLGLMLFLITAMDRPFVGKVSVSPESYRTALQSMDRWDLEFTARK